MARKKKTPESSPAPMSEQDEAPSIIRLDHPLPLPKKISALIPKSPALPGTMDKPAEEFPAVAKEIEHIWGRSNDREKPMPWGKIAFFGLLGTILLIATITFTSRNRPQNPAAISEKSTSAPRSDENLMDQDAVAMVERIEAAIRGYCAATTVEERAKYVRRPEKVKAYIQAHYPDGKVPLIRLLENPKLDTLTMENRADFWYATLRTDEPQLKNLIVELPPRGPARVDWEVDVIHQPYPWEQFVKEPPNGAAHDFRVHVTSAKLYSHEFSDEKRWKAYSLLAKGSEEYLYGYCETDGPIDRKLTKLLRDNGSNPVPVILHLKRPAGTLSPRGAVIESITSENWIYIDSPHPGS